MNQPIPAIEPGADERERECIAREKAALTDTTEHGHEDGRGGDDE